jgi:hypothetical protein
MSEKSKEIEWIERLKQFMEDVESLRSAMKLLVSSFPKELKKIEVELDDFIKEHGKDVEIENSGNTKFRLEYDKTRRFERMNKSHRRVLNSMIIIPEISVVNLICSFDGYLADLLRDLFKDKIELASLSSKNIVYSELIAIGSIEGVRQRLIEIEVENVLRDGWDGQSEYFSKLIDWNIKEKWGKWDSFYELIQTRNIIVHNGGKINQYYLSRIKKNTNIDITNLHIGDKKLITLEYINNILTLLQELAIQLTIGLRRKVFPNKQNEIDEAWTDISYELLIENKFKLLCDVLEDVMRLDKFHMQSNRFIVTANYCIAQIKCGNKQLAIKHIEKFDVSGMKTRYVMAKEIILGNIDLAIKLIPTAEILAWEYREWPLFSLISHSEEFRKAFQNHFKEDFSVQQLDSKMA